MKTIYRCRFEFKSGIFSTRGERLDDFRNGFWVNDSLQLTFGSDAKFWIPPGMIEFIEKDVVV